MMKTNLLQISLCALFLFANPAAAHAKLNTDTVSFLCEGKRLSGFLDLPDGEEASAIVIIVPGYGKTNFGEADWYYDSMRSNFVKAGLACFQWDKAGCGRSEGAFDANQPVESSAREVAAAIKELTRRNVAGSGKTGLWGISRAGWICPLVIRDNPQIAFWISVSGTDDKENFGYLLESNLRIEGRSEEQIQLLCSEWREGNTIFRKGGSFEEHQFATRNLRQDSLWMSISGDPYTKEGYERIQKAFLEEGHQFDEATGLMFYVRNFPEVLSNIQCPVLAIFGEKDANVDWRQTKALYEETIGRNPNARLTVKTLTDCNHSIVKCKTGGLHEQIQEWQFCDGYFEAMNTWFRDNGITK